jgi:hypothetical protein
LQERPRSRSRGAPMYLQTPPSSARLLSPLSPTFEPRSPTPASPHLVPTSPQILGGSPSFTPYSPAGRGYEFSVASPFLHPISP